MKPRIHQIARRKFGSIGTQYFSSTPLDALRLDIFQIIVPRENQYASHGPDLNRVWNVCATPPGHKEGNSLLPYVRLWAFLLFFVWPFLDVQIFLLPQFQFRNQEQEFCC